jgi:hypothetical protein
MMGGVLPETCWAIEKHWNNKFYYTVAPCWFFLWALYYDARIHEHQIPSIWHGWDQTGTRLSDSMDYQTEPTMTNVFTGNLLYCSIFRLILANLMPVAWKGPVHSDVMP